MEDDTMGWTCNSHEETNEWSVNLKGAGHMVDLGSYGKEPDRREVFV
jgi:hypothetical protein